MEHDIKNHERVKCFDLNLIEFDDNEEVVCEIRKHPFGLFVIYFTGIFISFVTLMSGILGSVWLERSSSLDSGLQNYSWVIFLVGVVLTIFVLAMTFISAFLYRHNVILVTSQKIAETLYTSIFNRSVSQLSLGDIQDVTVFQKGVFARIFNYGTIVIETAGEQNNYNFTFTPFPYGCSKDIISAHEENVRRYGN